MKPVLLLCVAVLAGCTHPLEIVGNGDISSASTERDCALEEAPCDIRVVNEYQETYIATPRAGYEFVGWDGCVTPAGNQCSFDVPAESVQRFWFRRVFPLTANFAPLCEGAPVSSYEAIRQEIFIGKGCSASGCHSNSSRRGGMSLQGVNAYDNIVNVRAGSSGLDRIEPGNADASYLYLKVQAKTTGDSSRISGSPMPLTGSALSRNQLAALESWIAAGAPRTGRSSVTKEVEQLLGLCD